MNEEDSRQSECSDESLGLNRDIHRRDFLNGVGVGIGSLLAPSVAVAFQSEAVGEQSPDYYPPALTGMRGSHPGSFEVAHALRELRPGRRRGRDERFGSGPLLPEEHGRDRQGVDPR